MAYEKQTWVDGVTPLDAEHLNHMEQGIFEANGNSGEDGGYYTPEVTQPAGDTMEVSFTPSKATMPEVASKKVTLPAGTPGADGKSAYAYAVDGGYTGTEAEFAEKLAQKQLTGTTNDLTPTQVYDAVSAGIPVKVQYTDSIYGLLSFTAFNVAESLNVIVSQTIVYYSGGGYILAELAGEKPNNSWFFVSTTLAQKTDIPETLPTPNFLTFTGAVTGSYDGSEALTVEIPNGGGGSSPKLLKDIVLTEDSSISITDFDNTLSEYLVIIGMTLADKLITNLKLFGSMGSDYYLGVSAGNAVMSLYYRIFGDVMWMARDVYYLASGVDFASMTLPPSAPANHNNSYIRSGAFAISDKTQGLKSSATFPAGTHIWIYGR